MLPQKLSLDLMQTQWAQQINPVLANPLSSTLILKNVSLTPGDNSVNHLLGQKLQGWFIVRMHGNFSQIYDTQDQNQIPNLTLQLNSSAAVIIDLVVY